MKPLITRPCAPVAAGTGVRKLKSRAILRGIVEPNREPQLRAIALYHFPNLGLLGFKFPYGLRRFVGYDRD